MHSRRKRLVDVDGVSAKSVIDGITASGLLVDDTTKYIKEVSYSQEKCKKGEAEETIISIYV